MNTFAEFLEALKVACLVVIAYRLVHMRPSVTVHVTPPPVTVTIVRSGDDDEGEEWKRN